MTSATSAAPAPSEAEHQVIHVRGLEKSYKDLKVLRGVDFDVTRGGVFALLGSNGAGKTTVVEMLAARVKAAAGAPRGPPQAPNP